MEDNNTVTATNESAQPVEKKESFGAKIKEWFRKKIVALKRQTNVIPLFLFLITSLIYLLSLAAFSRTAMEGFPNGDMLGFPVFVNCLLSILIVVLHLNAFPKRKKKINIPNYVLVYVFAAILLAMDILYYIKVGAIVAKNGQTIAEAQDYVKTAAAVSIVHIVFLGISVIALATLPLYSKLIMKINTSKVIEESQLDEVIETEDDD